MNANIKTLISHVKNYMTQHEKNKKGKLIMFTQKTKNSF